jgi:hypothetical protein
VAGRVKIARHLERPWMTPVHVSALAGTSEIEGRAPEGLIGANMAFRRSVLDRVSGFDPELGPGAFGFKDDSLFGWQIQQAGFRLLNSWGPMVEHHFEPHRLLRASFVSVATRRGQSDAYVRYHWKHESVAAPQVKLAQANVYFLASRMRNLRVVNGGEGCAESDMRWLRRIGFYRQYLIERKRARNYELRGLRKLGAAPRAQVALHHTLGAQQS